MKKYLRVTMPDGSKWDVPAQIIADQRARYYAKHDTVSDIDPGGQKPGDEPYDSIYAVELDYAMKSDYELKDWAANNMNWSDVEESAILVKHAGNEVEYQEGWVNGEKEIITK